MPKQLFLTEHFENFALTDKKKTYISCNLGIYC